MELTRKQRDKRIAVARDVIAQIDREKIPLQVVRYNGYVVGELEADFSPDDDLRAAVDQVQEHCEVCAKGAVLLSYARLYDNVPMGVILDDTEIDDEETTTASVKADPDPIQAALADTFDALTLDRIEAAFEGVGLSNPNLRAFAEWGRDFDGYDEDRLRAICQSIIDHDGEFVLPASPARDRRAETGTTRAEG